MEAARTATLRSSALPPLPCGGTRGSLTSYHFDIGEVAGTPAFGVEVQGQELSVVINERHPLYRDLLGPLAESELSCDQRVAKRLALVLLALARAEAASKSGTDRERVALFRDSWSDVAATFLSA